VPDLSRITTISSLVTFEKSVARTYTRRQSRLKSKMMSERIEKQLELCLAEETYEQPQHFLVIPKDETSVSEMKLPANLELQNIAEDVQHRFFIDDSLLNLLPALNNFSGKTEFAQVDKTENKEEIILPPLPEVENPNHKHETQTLPSDDTAKEMHQKAFPNKSVESDQRKKKTIKSNLPNSNSTTEKNNSKISNF